MDQDCRLCRTCMHVCANSLHLVFMAAMLFVVAPYCLMFDLLMLLNQHMCMLNVSQARFCSVVVLLCLTLYSCAVFIPTLTALGWVRDAVSGAVAPYKHEVQIRYEHTDSIWGHVYSICICLSLLVRSSVWVVSACLSFLSAFPYLTICVCVGFYGFSSSLQP